MVEWLVDTIANKLRQSYVKGFIDISGGDLSGNALTVRNGNVKFPNSSVSSYAISGGIGHDYMLFESQDTGSSSPITFDAITYNVYGTANFLADNTMYKWSGTKNGVSAYWNILSFNPGLYRVSMTGRWGAQDSMAIGFDTDGDGNLAFPNTFTEEGNALNVTTGGTFNISFIYKVQSVQNFNIIARNIVTVYSYAGLGRFQLLVERIGFLKNSGASAVAVSQTPSGATSSQNDNITGSAFGTDPTKPTDANEYIDLNESGTEWIYRIDPTGALFNT